MDHLPWGTAWEDLRVLPEILEWRTAWEDLGVLSAFWVGDVRSAHTYVVAVKKLVVGFLLRSNSAALWVSNWIGFGIFLESASALNCVDRTSSQLL